jgi:uncharacterized protein YxjI
VWPCPHIDDLVEPPSVVERFPMQETHQGRPEGAQGAPPCSPEPVGAARPWRACTGDPSKEIPMFRRHDNGGAAVAGPTTYQMRQQMFAIGDDFWIEDGSGRRAFKVDGKALRIRKTLILESASGAELYKIQTKLLHIRDTMEIEGESGRVASVKKKLISPLRERYDVHFDAGGQWKVQGNIVDHEYEIEGDSGKIADVRKKWFRVRDSYGIQVSPGQDEALVLAVAIVVDQMAHPHR